MSKAASDQAGDRRSSGSNSGSENSSSGNGLRAYEESLKGVQKQFVRLGVGPGPAIMASKMPPGNASIDTAQLVTNVYGVRLPSIPLYMYDVSVIGITKSGKEIDLTKKSGEDHLSTERQRSCIAAYDVLLKGPFRNNIMYYDGQKILYSLDKLDFKGEKCCDFEIGDKVIDPRTGQKPSFLEDVDRVKFTVAEVTEEFSCTLNDLSWISDDLKKYDRKLLQFMDIATSQHALLHPEEFLTFRGGKSYLLKPWQAGFVQQDCPNLPEGKFVAVGAHKSSCTVEGPKGRGACNIAVAVDTSKTAFHYEQNVMEKALTIVPNLLESRVTPSQIFELRQHFKGLFAVNSHDGIRTFFRISTISSQNACEATFSYEGGTITVQQYYQQKFNRKLQFPNAPLLVHKQSALKMNYHPMELSYILACQRVQQHQQTPMQVKGMKEACVIPPAKRMDQNDKNVRALKLLDERNQWLSKAGIQVIKTPLIVTARILPVPRISYYGDSLLSIDPVKMWSLGRNGYICPATISDWAIYLVDAGGRSQMTARMLRDFVGKLMQTCSQHGMRISKPWTMDKIQAAQQAVENAVVEAVKDGRCEFIFFVQDDIASLHDVMKDLERRYEVVTQDMKASRALDVVNKGKWQTLENVVNKLNVKMGGLNYEVVTASNVNWLNENRLFMGFSTSFSSPGAVTAGSFSVVGYAANAKSSCDFVGDFGFQDARRADNVQVVGRFVEQSVRRFKQERRKYPAQIIIYRSGISEGQFRMIIQDEVPLIREAIKQAGGGKISLTVVVVNRLHNVRLIPRNVNPHDRPVDQNIKPGTVVDAQLVHPRFSEFYLNSHKALQGTAKTPRYTVVVDDAQFSMDELEGMTYSLCFCHQIVSLSTSVPTPLYVATRYAERGRRLLAQRSSQTDATSATGSGGSRGRLDMDVANGELPYKGTKLANQRINA